MAHISQLIFYMTALKFDKDNRIKIIIMTSSLINEQGGSYFLLGPTALGFLLPPPSLGRPAWNAIWAPLDVTSFMAKGDVWKKKKQRKKKSGRSYGQVYACLPTCLFVNFSDLLKRAQAFWDQTPPTHMM